MAAKPQSQKFLPSGSIYISAATPITCTAENIGFDTITATLTTVASDGIIDVPLVVDIQAGHTEQLGPTVVDGDSVGRCEITFACNLNDTHGMFYILQVCVDVY